MARIGLGCMRLSTEVPHGDHDRDARAASVLDAALAAGIDLLDTADAYALDDDDVGHNERAIAAALDRHRARGGGNVRVVTKGGLVRPAGAWLPDGRARHLTAAARASAERLGAIDTYLLHAVDPQTALATSVRALARLRDAGTVRAIGLSNVNGTQLELALAEAPIATVEIELHPWKLDAIRGGLLAACAARGIDVLAHRPLGGPAGIKRAHRDRLLRAIGERIGATPPEVVLAWIASLGTIPLPGATRVETVESIARAARLELPEDVRAELAAHFLGHSRSTTATDAPRGDAEIVVIMGMPASGKSTLAADFTERGYTRFNRDERGGSLAGLAREVERALVAGTTKIVVDNTDGTRASRAALVEIARRRGASVRVIHVATELEDAQARAVGRILALHGRLLEPSELAKPKQIGVLAPSVLFRFRRDFEPPRVEEGFVALEEIVPPRRTSGALEATIFELDDLIWVGRPARPDQIALVDGARDRLAAARGLVAGTTWQVGRTPDEIAALEARLVELAGVNVRVLACPHPAGPPICWCRKPLPGLALAFAHAHDVDLSRSVHVGHGPADRGFARRAGMLFEVVD